MDKKSDFDWHKSRGKCMIKRTYRIKDEENRTPMLGKTHSLAGLKQKKIQRKTWFGENL